MGISMRGMQAFRWMSTFPDFMDKAMPIDGSPHMTSFDLLQWQTHHDIVKMMQAGGMHQAKIAVILSRVGLLTLFTPAIFCRAGSRPQVSINSCGTRMLPTHLSTSLTMFRNWRQ